MERVNPIVAREGTFIKSFPVRQFKEMLEYGDDTEIAMERHNIHGRLVFTRIGKGTGRRGADTWQIFLLPEE